METLTNLVTGPVLPATILLGLMLIWALLAILGAADLDLGGDLDIGSDFDLDASVDVDSPGFSVGFWESGFGGIGLFLLKWLNIRGVPIMLWLAVFSLVWWFVSASLWSVVDQHFFEQVGILSSSLLVLKNIAIALPITKLVTTPMVPWFVNERVDSRSLIGKECRISSLQATTEYGQVKFQTDGAPLLLNVRTDGPQLVKGDVVWITHYDADNRVYIVSPTTAENVSADHRDNYEADFTE